MGDPDEKTNVNPAAVTKLSFGFSKTIKKTKLECRIGETTSKVSKIELIDSIEGSSINIVGKNPQDSHEKKLVIPMTNDQKTTPLNKLMEQRLKIAGNRNIKSEQKSELINDLKIKEEPKEENLEQQAARELIEDLQKKIIKAEVKVFEVPINADDLPLEGAKESSLDDYDDVPIADFGKAMLRGMGWKDVENKKPDTDKPEEGPVARPKGMGLGADKVIKAQPLLIKPSHSETLEVKRNACVKVLAGKHQNLYGTIEGFDDGGGRVIVKLAIGALKVTINEFMVQPVGKQEFATYGKVLNSAKYEEYKRGAPPKQEARRSRSHERHRRSSQDRGKNGSTEHHRRNSRERSHSRHRHSSHRRPDLDSSSKKYRGRSSSSEHRRKSSKHKKHSSSPDPKSSNQDKKHKKKSKKSKHRRDRS